MAEVTVKQFAEVVGITVERLLAQMGDAGLEVTDENQSISDEDKVQLLSHLRNSHGNKAVSENKSDVKRITLRRKQHSELGTASVSQGVGKSRKVKKVSIEIRTKRTYAKRADLIANEEAKEAEQQALIKAKEEAKLKEKEAEKLAIQAAEKKLRADAEKKAQLKAQAKEIAETKEKEAASIAEVVEVVSDAPENVAKKEQKKPAKEERPDKNFRRRELHVADDKKGRRKKKSKVRHKPVPTVDTTKHAFEKPTEPVVKDINIPETISLSELAQKMSVKAAEVIKVFMGMGTMVTINQVLDNETAAIVVEEMGHNPVLLKENKIEESLSIADDDAGEKTSRPPVITIMGHVDHGKTSLLDYIRKSKVASGEAGGITQHVGAYHVMTDNGAMTFLDTPGHAAFSAMRARGAVLTDIIVLVVAADDGVKPQTVEAIQHAKAAEVPIVIAVNKIDRAEADPDRVKTELSQHEIVPEDWGGDTMFVHVSAHTGEGIDSLLDTILLQAEVMELKAVPNRKAMGSVIESSLDKGRGSVATVLVKTGTLHKGEIIIAGQEFGRVRAMFDESGNQIDNAGPSIPVVLLGLSGTPNAGDEVVVVNSEKQAREIALARQSKAREIQLSQQKAASLDIFSKMEKENVSTLAVLLKADVRGSSEALNDALSKLGTDEVAVNVVANGVGGINESDVNLAIASGAVMIGFNVRADATARRRAEENGMELRYYSVIYDVIDDIKQALSGLLSPEIKEQIVGLAEVRDIFVSPKLGAIAGCLVIEGNVKKNNPIRVLRDNVVIYEGELESLRRFKDNVNEVKAGTECGIGVKNYNDVKVGDQIEVFEKIEVNRSL